MKRKLQKVLMLSALCATGLTVLPPAVTPVQAAQEDSLHEASPARERLSFNQGWKFIRRNIPDAVNVDYPDETLERWESVDLPHTVREEGINASGNRNYQGPAMYRKHFMLDDSYANKRIVIEFEAVMGVTEVWVNGQHMSTKCASETGSATNYGGYLPFTVDVTDVVKTDGSRNVITVLADNSDNGLVPPGKPQGQLDFSYFGGIYRNVWLTSTEPVHISDVVEEFDKDAGIFVKYPEVSKEKASVRVKTDLKNESDADADVVLKTVLVDEDGSEAASLSTPVSVKAASRVNTTQTLNVTNPKLWHPDTPNRYTLVTEVTQDGAVVDTYEQKIGIRTIEADVNQGIVINGEPFECLNGVNRHQEYAYVGFAASAALQRDDAVKYKSAGFNVVRTAHHPQSVDFLEACDELGILVIEAIPGWQYWNSDPVFAQRIKSDLRRIVQRDRNRPCMLAIEASLNESTGVESWFTNSLCDLVKEEYPAMIVSAENPHNGANADIIYGKTNEVAGWSDHALAFIREYGDFWEEQFGWNFSNTCRAERDESGFYPGGEARMVMQGNNRLFEGYSFNGTGAISLADAMKNYTDSNHRFIGVTMWIGIDHNRGYDPHSSDCGIWDLMRTPKYSYYAFASQRDVEENPELETAGVETGPMVFAATSWSEKAPVVDKSNGETLGTDAEREIYVYSNAEKVRLSVVQGDQALFEKTNEPMNYKNTSSLDHPPFLFSAVPYTNGTWLKVEGLDADGNVIAEQEIRPAGEVKKVGLEEDLAGRVWEADGSDMVRVEVSLLDKDGLMSTESMPVAFEVEGEAELVGDGDERVGTNPSQARFGKTAIYLRSTRKAGDVKVKAWTAGGEVSELTLKTVEPDETQADFEVIADGIPLEDSSMFLAEKEAVIEGSSAWELEKGTVNIGNQDYASSLKVDNCAPLSYQLNGNYAELTGKMAVQGTSDDGVIFKVYGDGALLYASEPITDQIADLDVDVTGVQKLTLVAESLHEGHAFKPVWLSAYVKEGRADRDQSELKQNIVSKASVSATSTEAGSSANNAVDGSLETVWHSEGIVSQDNPEALTLTFEKPVSVRNALVQFEHDYQTCTYEIQTTTDGTTWTTVAENEKTAHGNLLEDEFTAKDITGLRVLFTKVASAQGSEGGARNCAVIKELAVYEDKGVVHTDDYNLAGLAVAGADLVYEYGKTDYAVDVYEGDAVYVKAVPSNAKSSIAINGENAALSNAALYEQKWIEVQPDENGNIVITVTSPDGAGHKDFTIHCNRVERTSWNSAEDYVPNVNGARGWSYGRIDDNNKFIAFDGDAQWVKGETAWSAPNSGDWMYAGPRYLHPGWNRTARAWTVPADGTYAVEGIFEKMAGQWGKVRVQILHNSTVVWPEDADMLGDLGENQTWKAAPVIEAKAGDQIVFALDARDGNGGDGSWFDTTIRPFDADHADTFDYLSDLEWTRAEAGYASVYKDHASAGTALSVNTGDGFKTYHKGIGTHATSVMEWDIKDKGYIRFEAIAGLDEHVCSEGSHANVSVQVFLNNEEGEPVVDIQNMSWRDAAQKISVPLDETSEKLIIKVLQGENNWSDHFDFADAKLIRKDEAPEVHDTSILKMIIAVIEKANFEQFRAATIEGIEEALNHGNAVVDSPESQSQINDEASSLNRRWLEARLEPNEELLKEKMEKLK